MPKFSERYLDWYGTRVPFVSRSCVVLLVSIGAVSFSAINSPFFNVYAFHGNWLIPILLSLLVGVFLHIFYLIFLMIRYLNPTAIPDLNNLVSQIHQKFQVTPKSNVWIRKSDDQFIVSIFNPLFNAVLVSKSMVNHILGNPESGEALLAFHLLRIPKDRWFGDLLGSVVLFSVVSFLSSLILIPLINAYYYALTIWGFLDVISMITILGYFILVLFIFIAIVKGTFWKKDSAFTMVMNTYGIHPNVAKIQVETDSELNEEQMQNVIRRVREWEKSKRYSRRIGVTVFFAIGCWFLGSIPLFIFGYVPILIIRYQPHIFAFVGALISYLWLKKWDNLAMNEMIDTSKNYDELIFTD
ncbi:MAG: hypothetical protein ACFFCX_09615 [Candidatus Sifarchaeia archaeon]